MADLSKLSELIQVTPSKQTHWENVYTAKGEDEVSWFQETPAPSLELLERVGVKPAAALIDVGGGASRLVDCLLARGFGNITVLDLSAAALAAARMRLGRTGDKVKWIVADAAEWRSDETYDLWHDRAAFHFLTQAQDQQAYIRRLKQSLRRGGHVIIGTFAPDGPATCSGLPVARHNAESLSTLLGDDFVLADTRRHEHTTPWKSVQKFQFSTFHYAE
ncbi:class I SAM-dependent methyltransferase [Acidocella sp.]|uniref:class I SAM-dependent methyltransferase n=1 Tax=Acidocella sp. TaxID=50710 RepID=UPI002D7EA91C|nr:class I SAM-dependent methyltransferase [Acidocella sp.]